MLARKSNRRNKEKANRLHLIMAIVFLLVGLVLFRLCSIQVLKYDLYVALASDQHQVYNELKPDRGRIFIQDNQEFSDSEFFPVATNKDFALVYAIPNEVKNISEVAEKLYIIFDQDKVADEVEELLENDEYFSDNEKGNIIIDEQKKEEFKKIKRELEIKLRREEMIENYENIFKKKNDPYEPIKHKVNEKQLAKINELDFPGINYLMETHRYYPEGNIGAHILGFIGFNEDEKCGQYGLEGFFNEELSGKLGSIRAERSATGDLIIMNDREYNKPQNGSDLILTINRSIQFFACRKLNEIAMRHGADGGSVIVMDPYTGAILTMCSWPDYDPNNYGEVDDINTYNNPAIFSQFEPGSIFKVFTMAAGIDQGKIIPETTYHDEGMVKVEGWPKPLKNSDFDTHGGHGIVDMVTVLEESLNTGAIFAMQKTGADIFADYVKYFGFDEKTGIELETEGSNNISSLERENIRPVEAATASYGQGITVTPLQMITAYSAIANGGILMKPYLVGEIISPSGERIKTQPKQIRRVISERTAMLLSGMLVNVVEGGHALRAGVDGYFVGGKTGTAEVPDKEKRGYSDMTIHTFVGFAPIDEPKFVMLVKLDDPKSVRFAASSAAPLFGEIAEFILNYYQIPKER